MHAKERTLKTNSQHYHKHLFRIYNNDESQVQYETQEVGNKILTMLAY